MEQGTRRNQVYFLYSFRALCRLVSAENITNVDLCDISGERHFIVWTFIYYGNAF